MSMTPDEFAAKWRRLILGEFTEFAYRMEGPALKERMGKFVDWFYHQTQLMAQDARNIKWPALVGEPEPLTEAEKSDWVFQFLRSVAVERAARNGHSLPPPSVSGTNGKPVTPDRKESLPRTGT